MPPPDYWVPPSVPSYAPVLFKPSPGLRTFLLVLLGVVALVTGLFSAFGLAAVRGGDNGGDSVLLLALFALLFGLCALAFVGVVIRATWSRSVAIITGVAISLTCIGLVLGIPILIAASRADLRKAEATATGSI
jgi:uncharacterized membrane protein